MAGLGRVCFLVRSGRAGGGSGLGKLAGLPEFDEVFEAAEDADEEGQNQGVQSRDQPRLGCGEGGFGAEVGAQGGDVHGQGGGGMI